MNKKNNLVQRIFSGLTGALLILSGMIWSPWSYFLIFLFILIFTNWEFLTLIGKKYSTQKAPTLLVSILIYSLSFFYFLGYLDSGILIFILPTYLFVIVINLFYSDKNIIEAMSSNILSLIYVTFPFICCHYIAFESGHYNFWLILLILTGIWINDIGAFTIGKLIGKNKLFERISPKKTWEGFWGGLIFVFAYYAFLYHFSLLPKMWADNYQLLVTDWVVLSIIISVMSTLGDLVESGIKRAIGVKDSSALIPGHGGFLDRFDSLIFVLPMIVFYIVLRDQFLIF